MVLIFDFFFDFLIYFISGRRGLYLYCVLGWTAFCSNGLPARSVLMAGRATSDELWQTNIIIAKNRVLHSFNRK